MHAINRVFIAVLLLAILPSQSKAEFQYDHVLVGKIDSLINAYGKLVIVNEIIGNDKSNFTIIFNNQLQRSPNSIKGINDESCLSG